MSTDKKYNGWTNYETWNVALWIDNEEGSSRHWAAMAQECYDESEDTVNRLSGTLFTREENASRELADRLKSEHAENAPELTGTYADLLSAALSEVNWDEIAEHYINDVDKANYDEEEEAADGSEESAD